MYENQYGFRKFHSTELALLQLFDRVSNALADHKHVIGVFMDLSKAFDTLDHTILIRKLEYYGLRGVAKKWFKNYLTNRKQYVCFENNIASDIRLSRNVVNKEYNSSRRFVRYLQHFVR